MKIQINGQTRDFSFPLSLAGLVELLGMKTDRVAVELNGDIVARDRWAATNLSEADRLEIVHFVGGGCTGNLVKGVAVPVCWRTANGPSLNCPSCQGNSLRATRHRDSAITHSSHHRAITPGGMR